MAELMTKTFNAAWRGKVRGMLIVGAMLSVSASAEILTDPTRPPAALLPAQMQASGEHAGPVLQSVLVSRGRRIAIISGKEVKVNDKVGGARVVRITDTEVVLRNGKQVQRLKLFPDVSKQSVRAVGRKTVRKRGKERQVKE